ncbi:MAG: efflux RND transporter permease subunit [Betaproteobacteria bacterium]|nr:efflux RND transporter permease subunit [Betaproteobacteria bacterium]
MLLALVRRCCSASRRAGDAARGGAAINVTTANVLIALPGASSADVLNMVARPAEHVLSQTAGIEHTYSVSRPGMAVMTVQFEVGVPRTEALADCNDAQCQPGLAAGRCPARCRRSCGPRASTTKPVLAGSRRVGPRRHQRCRPRARGAHGAELPRARHARGVDHRRPYAPVQVSAAARAAARTRVDVLLPEADAGGGQPGHAGRQRD